MSELDKIFKSCNSRENSCLRNRMRPTILDVIKKKKKRRIESVEFGNLELMDEIKVFQSSSRKRSQMDVGCSKFEYLVKDSRLNIFIDLHSPKTTIK